MAFSDDQLSHLKKLIEPDSSHIYGIPRHQLIDLVARLEAAEKIAEHNGGHDEDCDACHGEPCECGYEDNDKAWRKAAGK